MESNRKEVSLQVLIFLGVVATIAAAPVTLTLTKEAKDFLVAYGYLVPPDPKSGRLIPTNYVGDSIKLMQRFHGLSETGFIDNPTSNLMKKPRCGVRDVVRADGFKRKRRYNLQGGKWTKKVLSWKVGAMGDNGISLGNLQKTYQKALKKWEAVTNLDFTYTSTNSKADIQFKFVKGAHGDAYPFSKDGRNVIAHAFYPQGDDREESGDVHFNDVFNFTLDSNGTNLLWVTLHELGHSLGLDHSMEQNSIMYPMYRGHVGTDFDLHADDVNGIQNIYGKRNVIAPKLPIPGPEVPLGQNCFRTIKAVLSLSDGLYVFNDDKLYILNRKRLVLTGPVQISSIFKGVKKVDAAFVTRDGYIRLFSGQKYHEFFPTKRWSRTEYIYQGFKGVYAGDIDASFIYNGNGHLYLFKGSQYWRMRYRIYYFEVWSPEYPKQISKGWPNVPNNLDAVMVWKNFETFFFKGTKFYEFDRKWNLKSGSPHDIARTWLKSINCGKVGAISRKSKKSAASKFVAQITIATLMMSVIFSLMLSLV